MRPLTEALLYGNSENLTQKGWKTNEQLRCFKKADALLDYIGRIKPGEYVQTPIGPRLNDLRFEGIWYCLNKDMPSPQMRARSLQTLSTLLSIGEELMLRAAWLYRNYPILFKVRYALSKQDFEKDADFYFIKGHVVPERSFPSFKTGENPAISRDNTFLKHCVDMYQDSIFETAEFKDFSNQPLGKKFPYNQWIRKTKSGRKFLEESRALHHIVHQLALRNEVKSTLDKAVIIQLSQKKQKTI